MNTESNRPPGGPEEEPVVIGAGLRPVEDRLRRELAREAVRISPTDRLGPILKEAHALESRSTNRRWLVPAAAAAAALLVAGTLWAVNRPSSTTPPVAGTASSTAVQSTTPNPSTAPPSSVPTQTATGTATGSATGSATTSVPPTKGPPGIYFATVPVYYVGPVVAGSDNMRLFREFVSAGLTGPAAPETRGLGALQQAMGPRPFASSYVAAWVGIRPTAVSLDTPGQIEVTLSAGLGHEPAGGSALAVQQLVWTVQAAVGKGALPVRFVVPAGDDVAPGLPSNRTYNRPVGSAAVYAVLAPIWVDEPFRTQELKAGSRLTVSGVASTFEANVQWQLLKSGAEAEKGFTTASAGAPERGTYTFTTTVPLAPGSYVIRVFETSPQDGSVSAEQRIPFTVG